MISGDQPGPLIGAGRAADVYALGGRRVVRRYRNGDSAEREAGVMAYLAEAGFPVPRVYDASGPDLVMERLSGRDMLADLSGRLLDPGRLAAQIPRAGARRSGAGDGQGGTRPHRRPEHPAGRGAAPAGDR
jgi:Phosphotransferase enzyme family